MSARVHSCRVEKSNGYIDARPYLPDRRNLLQRAAGPYIRVIRDRVAPAASPVNVRYAPIATNLRMAAK